MNRSERPRVLANFALTWDARASTRNHTPSDFSSPADKRRLLEIRARGDAVMVGRGTLESDRMSMGLPSEDLRRARLARGQQPFPLRIILTGSGSLDTQAPVFKSQAGPIHVFTTQAMPLAVREALAGCATVHLAPARVELPDVLRTLRRQLGVRTLVCEGGPSVIRSLAALNVLDDLYLTFCPRIFGGVQAPTLTGGPADFLPASAAFQLRSIEPSDDEIFCHYTARRRVDR